MPIDPKEVDQARYKPGLDGNTGKMLSRVAILSRALYEAEDRIKALEKVAAAAAGHADPSGDGCEGGCEICRAIDELRVTDKPKEA